ncbi:TetR/AcrR family transcriptional regulator [uncultured Pseudokineococcus sp.]|uniref:TetR/AcrR family transcriptional regulator n=1 Tax=uncultured Pseudokineococcus sp. TaxID=1642928 RepID=UPI00262DEE61|nr:TetR/AcrR family transcriptional regulator [uncultured Pseudokineococcus sp.]
MVSTARERAREALTADIVATARGQLAEVGAAALSLRAVARELGLASSAVYRYVPSRDDLLTRLLVAAYESLGAAAEDADDAALAPRERWVAVCRGVRTWGLAHPHEWALLYGSPVPGYAAPQDTVVAAGRSAAVFGGVLGDAARTGRLAGRPPVPGRADLVGPAVVPVLGGEHPALDDDARSRAVLAWSSALGLVSFELFGQLVGVVTDRDAFFAEQVGRLADVVGLQG